MITPLAARRGLITPLSSGIQRESAAVSWWLSGGISAANCIAAYQAKGAADYAASKVNLNSPGTYNAVKASTNEVDWDATNGWKGKTAGYLKMGYSGYDQTHSLIIRFSSAPSGNVSSFGKIVGSGNYILLYANQLTGNAATYYGTGSYTKSGGAFTSGVFAFCTNDAYLDGSLFRENVGNLTVNPTEIYFVGTDVAAFTGYVQAFAVYNIDIAAYITELTTAMNAL